MSDKKTNKIGSRIAKARKDAGLTQADVADELNISYQAVSLWENEKAVPDIYNLLELAKLLEVSVSSLVEDRGEYIFTTRKNIFEWDHMATFVKHAAKANKMPNTQKALGLALKAHEGQTRKKSDIPYIYHPLNMACHALAMNIKDDAVIAAILLHDVVEDCGYTYDDLPVDDEVKNLVSLMTHKKGNGKNMDETMKPYFKALASNPKAALIKCIDRCNNITTMSWGLSRDRIYRTIMETEKYIFPLLQVIKDTPEYNDVAWLLKYQIESILDIYKRLM